MFGRKCEKMALFEYVSNPAFERAAKAFFDSQKETDKLIFRIL